MFILDNYVGKRLDGRYEIKDIIGVGGMAVVYKAYDNIDDRIVAIKVLKEEFLANEEFRRRFKNESKAIAVLSHPNIVKVYDVSFGDKLQYIVMEYIEGITLKEYIEQQKVINWKEAVHFVVQILRALQHAHDKGIVHRDIKPQNIMLLQNGNIKVTDFGIARFSRSETRTMTENAIGSVHYISPEQARGEITDDKADIYSVGVVLYEMITGRLPFESDSAVSVAIMQVQSEAVRPRDINDTIPIGLEQITMHAMQKNPRDRYQSAAEMLLDLEEFKRNPSIKFDYSYFVDKEPTRFVEKRVPSRAAALSEPANVAPAVAKTETESKNRSIPLLAGIVAGVLIIVAVFGGILINKLLNREKITVANFIGMNYEEQIKGNSKYADYKFEIVEQANGTKTAGEVFDQSPIAGEEIVKGKIVKLVIAKSNATATIPDNLIGKTYTEVYDILNNLGFSNIVQDYVSDDTVADGTVAKITPAAGTSTDTSSKVTVYVSKDSAADLKPVPGVVGWALEMAKMNITATGFQVGLIDSKPSSLPLNTVIEQSAKEGDMLPAGTSINLIVSTGVPESSSANLSVTLPNIGATATRTLSVFVNNELNSQKTVLMNGGSHTLSLSGSGGPYDFVVIIDEQTVCAGKVDFTKTPAEITERVDTEYTDNSGEDGDIIPSVVEKTKLVAKTELEHAGFKNVEYDYQGKSETDSVVWVVESQSPNDVTIIMPYSTKIVLKLKPAVDA